MKAASFLLALVATAAIAAPWTSHGPIGGIVTQLAVAPADRSVIYVIAPDGVFRTRDAGATWSNVTGPIAAPGALALSGDAVVVAAENGVFRSEDGGATWRLVRNGVSNAKLLADPRDSSVLYLAGDCRRSLAEGGVFKSSDGGRSFVAANQGLDTYERCVSGLALDPLDPDRLYLTWVFQDISGASRSDDAAGHWSDTQRIPERGVVARPASQQRFGIGSNGFAFLSSADGVNWSSLTAQAGIEEGPGTATRFTALAIDPTAGRLFLGASNGAYRSGDGGISWIRLGGAALDQINSLDFETGSGAVIIGTNFGLFRSAGFPWYAWSDLHVGNSAMPIRSVVADPSNGDVYAVAERHILHSSDLGQTWERLGDPLPNPYSSIVVDAGHQLYSFDYRKGAYRIQKLSDEGHWDEIRSVAALSSLVADPRQPGTLYAGEIRSLAVTRDGGATWEQLPAPSSGISLSIDPRDTSSMLITTFDGLYRSADGGHTWTLVPSAHYPAQFGIVRAPSNPDVMYLYARDSSLDFVLARSTDGGQTWSTLAAQPGGGSAIGQIVVDPRDPDTVYAPTFTHGVMRTTNGGQSWQSINDGLPESFTVSLAIDSRGAFLHAGTLTRGVWELPLGPSRRRSVRY